MRCDVEVQDLPTSVVDGEPDIEQLESDSRHDQEVHRRDRVSMVAEECPPLFAFAVAETRWWQVPGHGRNADVESQLLELGVDSPCAPAILPGDPPNQFSKVRVDPWTRRAGL